MDALEVKRETRRRQVAAEAPDQPVVPTSSAQDVSERRVVDLEDRSAVVAEVAQQPEIEPDAVGHAPRGQRVASGAATVTVHPRGNIETERAAEILEGEGAVEVIGHDLANQSFEHAASRTDGYWVRHFMLDNPTGADCIYCRLFPAHKHEH